MKVTFVGGATCTVNGNQMRVFAKPNARFTITSDDSLCFKGNQLCILDQSFPGTSNAPIKKRIFQLSNGYLQIDSVPYTPQLCYHNTADTTGHLYSLVLEVSDTNGCVSRLVKTDSVRLFPKINIDFQIDFPLTCGDIITDFLNESITPLSGLARYYWDFKDGSKDSTHWSGLTHVYASPGPYFPALFVWDHFNCPDTVNSPKVVSGILPDSLIYAMLPLKQCYAGNQFLVAAYNPLGKQYWKIYDAANNLLYAFNDRVVTDTFRLPTCGIYRVNLKVTFEDCEVETDTLITVLGPKTIIHNPVDSLTRIKHLAQCEIFDTIYYKTPVPYLTCLNGNGGMYHLWDFGDAYAPPCTTDTRKGINIGMNCNFSHDSMEVKHIYTPGKEGCYTTSLYIKDSLTGCDNVDSLTLSLTNPNAHADPSAIPPRRGLVTLGQCLFGQVFFDFQEVLPECRYEKAWLNLDSACGKDNWIVADEVNKRTYEYVYTSTCDTSGYVTVGLIIKNGQDKNGNDCYDTAWYHHKLRLLPIDVNFDFRYERYCKPYSVRLIPNDSIQYDMSVARWNHIPFSYYPEDSAEYTALPLRTVYNFADTVVQYFGLNDTIISSQRLFFYRPGVFSIGATFANQFGCAVSNTMSIGIGFYKNFDAAKRISCVKDSIRLEERIQYYDPNYFDLLNPVLYWKMPARAAANKEKIWWDIGDGKGFSYMGSKPYIKYDKPGTYTITMVVQDSTGCLDTMVRTDFLRITDLKPKISLLQSSYLCAPQIVQFKDASIVIDTFGTTTPSVLDSVIIYNWNFGDGTTESLLKDPAHNFAANGNFTITLTAITEWGCKDTAQANIELKGPKPSFIIADTIGCEPFQTTFINTTGKPLQTWTWYFGDPANQTFTTTNDNSVSFTYLKAGVYSVKVLGTENVFNPTTGNTIICNSFFPDPLTNLPERKVYVLPTPPMDVVFKDTICVFEELQLTAIGDSLYKDLTWIYGDEDTLHTQRPDTVTQHVFAMAGTYLFTLIPINSSGVECVDTVQKNIVVTDVKADFEIDSSNTPAFVFNNTSAGAVRYEWNFGKPAVGAGNISNVLNGAFKYGTDTGTYVICLTSFNEEDCWDSICKAVRIVNAHVIIPNVFTPDNNDNKNDAFDIDIDGFTVYELQIYNRWGTEVFKSDKDGIQNDGINWNGKDHNEGTKCAAGTYYFIFTYKLITESKPNTVHGTITLIR
ncbi:MAG: PKD domain-containing protein [Bacteroidota bacterium]